MSHIITGWVGSRLKSLSIRTLDIVNGVNAYSRKSLLELEPLKLCSVIVELCQQDGTS